MVKTKKLNKEEIKEIIYDFHRFNGTELSWNVCENVDNFIKSLK